MQKLVKAGSSASSLMPPIRMHSITGSPTVVGRGTRVVDHHSVHCRHSDALDQPVSGAIPFLIHQCIAYQVARNQTRRLTYILPIQLQYVSQICQVTADSRHGCSHSPVPRFNISEQGIGLHAAVAPFFIKNTQSARSEEDA